MSINFSILLFVFLSLSINLYHTWLNGVLIWYLTWTNYFIYKKNRHVAKSYWYPNNNYLKGQNYALTFNDPLGLHNWLLNVTIPWSVHWCDAVRHWSVLGKLRWPSRASLARPSTNTLASIHLFLCIKQAPEFRSIELVLIFVQVTPSTRKWCRVLAWDFRINCTYWGMRTPFYLF